jgi:autotransporter passenger strand-loop-strand repeat protein
MTSTFESPIADASVTIGTDGTRYINAANFNDGVTTLTGTAEPGDSVTVVDRTRDSVVGNAVVNPDGTWSVTVSGLTNGNIDSYAATATDAAGDVASSSPFTFTVDTSPAGIAITTTGGVVGQASQKISGTTTGVAPGSTVLLFDNGGNIPIGNATVGIDGSWSATVDLYGNGAHSIVAQSTAPDGNIGTATIGFNLDASSFLTTLVNFGDGSLTPGLTADANGNLFGVNAGVAFEIAKTPDGYASATILANAAAFTFLPADANGDLFGSNYDGPYGSLFEFAKTANGYSAAITLASFNYTDGYLPGALIVDANGNLLGTALGGANGNGVVFELAKTANGYASTPTDLVTFNFATNGAMPGSLITDANGDLFGTTHSGGPDGQGTVFEIAKTSNGYASTLTTLVAFNGTDGYFPGSTLAMDANGDLFGTTAGQGTVSGTVFEIAKTANGYASTPVTLASLGGAGNLVVDANGNLFGITAGAVFELAKTASGYASTPVILNFDSTMGSPTSLTKDASGIVIATTSTGAVVEIASTLPVRITAVSPSDGAGDATVSGTTSEDGATLSIYDGSTLLGTTTSNADGTWSFNAPLASGVNNLTTTTADASGNPWTSPVVTANLVANGTVLISQPTSDSYLVEGSGALNVVYGATITGATVLDGGVEYIGGISNGASVLGGGTEDVNGADNNAVVSAGGAQNVMAGGTARGATVSAGGFQGVEDGTVNATTLSGNQQILAGGIANETVVDTGGDQYVADGGVANQTTVNSGGLAYVGAGGTMDAALIAGGAELYIASGGAAGQTTINNGGVSYVDAGGVESNAIINAGGRETVIGSSTGASIETGGLQQDLGSVSGAVVASGGTQQITNGGSATNTTVNTGGFEAVSNGGLATDTNLSGSQQVLAGGAATGTVVEAGGYEYVGSGGQTTGTVIVTNGFQYVDAGATDSNSAVLGGYQHVAGTATGTTIDAGGEQDVGAGGVSANSSLLNGTERVLAGGMANGVDFGGSTSATLVLGDPSLFTGTVANFGAGDRIDFRDITNASLDGSGDLTMTTGSGGSYSWALIGQYAAADIGIASDGAGGTLLTYNPADTTHTINLAAAAHA